MIQPPRRRPRASWPSRTPAQGPRRLPRLAGVAIKGVASIDETAGVSPGPRPEMVMMKAVAMAPTPIEAGSSQISISVAVRYLIG